MICGIFRGISDMCDVRQNPSIGVKESKNIFTYFLTDTYR